MRAIKLVGLVAAALVAMIGQAAAAKLRPETVAAYDAYVAAAEARMASELAGHDSFMAGGADGAGLRERLRRGEVVIEARRHAGHDRGGQVGQQSRSELGGGLAGELGSEFNVPGGLIHDWSGAVFIPGATLQRVLAAVQDYDHQQHAYAPDVERSRLLRRAGDDFDVFLRFRRVKVVTVTLNSEHHVHYERVDDTRAWSRSYSTRIREVEGAGTAHERELPAGDDHGFLWRMNSYWRFAQADGGVYVACEAISLTRDIPVGLGWMVSPFVESVPRESLRFTLEATKKAVMERK